MSSKSLKKVGVKIKKNIKKVEKKKWVKNKVGVKKSS